MKALQVFAGPRARARLHEGGLHARDVRVIPAAAGGPKGLVLNPLDRYIFSQWLPHSTQAVHLLGASIGAWRMASAAMPDADTSLARMAEDYITQRYDHAPGQAPTARHVSEVLARQFDARLGTRAAEVLAPSPDWIRRLPNAKLPDRDDFKAYGDDVDGRIRIWRQGLAESQRLADEFAALVGSNAPIEALPLG